MNYLSVASDALNNLYPWKNKMRPCSVWLCAIQGSYGIKALLLGSWTGRLQKILSNITRSTCQGTRALNSYP